MNKKPSIHPDDIMYDTKQYTNTHSLDYFYQEFSNDPTIECIYAGAIAGPNNISLRTIPDDILRNYILKIINP